MILITGASGFIGSALAWHYNRAGRDDLLLVDDLGAATEPDTGIAPEPKFRNLLGLAFQEYWEKAELLDRVTSGRALPPIDAVAHLGACSDTTEGDAGFLLRNNFAYTQALASWCLQHGSRFVYASSAATYGDGSAGYEDDSALLDGLRPLNAYGFSKHLFDLWALRRGALSQIVGLKYFNVFGPNEYHKGKMRSLVPRAYEQLQSGNPIRLFRSDREAYRDGEQRRDFLYVKDAVAVTAWFLDNPEANGIFNVGTGRSRTWNDLATAVCHAAGLPTRIEYIEMPAALRGRYQYSTEAPVSRLLAVGAPAPRWTLEAAITEYVRAYLHPGYLRLQDAAGPLANALPASEPRTMLTDFRRI